VGEPGAGVGGTFGVKERVFGIGHDVAVGLAAFFNAVDDSVDAAAQLGVVDPAEGVAGAHEEAAGVGAGEIFFPEGLQAGGLDVGDFAGALVELTQQLVGGEGGQQVLDVVLHRCLKDAAVKGDAGAGCEGLILGRLPGGGIGDLVRIVDVDAFAILAGRAGDLLGECGIALIVIDRNFAADGDVAAGGENGDLGEGKSEVGAVRGFDAGGWSGPVGRHLDGAELGGGEADVAAAGAAGMVSGDVIGRVGEIFLGEVGDDDGRGEGCIGCRFKLEAEWKALAGVELVTAGIHDLRGGKQLDHLNGKALAEVDLNPGGELGVGDYFGAVGAIGGGRRGGHAQTGLVGGKLVGVSSGERRKGAERAGEGEACARIGGALEEGAPGEGDGAGRVDSGGFGS